MVDSRLGVFRNSLVRARQREDSHNAESLYFPGQYERDLAIASAEAASDSADFLRICVSDRADPESFRLTLWRDLAASGAKVRVVHLVSHLGLIRALEESIRLDEESGIQVAVVAAAMLSDDLVKSLISEFAILDQGVTVQAPAELHTERSGLWTVSASAENSRLLQETFTDLWSIALETSALPQDLDLEEPLVQSAPLLTELAPVLCGGNHINATECDWYHGSWQLFRLMDLVSTPTWHHDFYTDSLSDAVAAGARDLLISGTADYSVFAYVVEALKGLEGPSSVTIVDLCGTPLFACRWYGQRTGYEPTVVTKDIIDFLAQSDRSFDAIVTDAFLTRFQATDVRSVLAGWHGALRPGGRVITTVRCHAERVSGQDEEEAVRGFRSRAKSRWERWSPFIDLAPHEVADRAEVYARRMVSNPIGTQQEILDLISHDFNVSSSEIAGVPGELHPTSYIRMILTPAPAS